MRTTLTLEEDVSARLREQVRKTGRSFKETVNALLRRGLNAVESTPSIQRFEVKARDLGGGHVDFDDVGEVLERFEGPDHR